MFFGLSGHAIAATGRDTNGLFLPLYFQSQMRYGSEMWFQPMLMYGSAISIKLFGLSEGTVRLPMALFAIADVILIYFVAQLLFRRTVPAIAAAVLLACTPAHVINGRVALDFQAALPFMLGWLWCLLQYLDRGQPRLLLAAGGVLGIGLYTYIASYMLMPIYVALTLAVLAHRREPLRSYGLVIAGFATPLLLAIPFLVTHPTVIRDVLWHYDRTQPLGSDAVNLFQTYFGLGRFARAGSVYLQFWSPRFLFVDGPGALWASGVFLLPVAGLAVVGLVSSIRRHAPQDLVILAGLLTAPIPASLAGDVDAIHRASMTLPFGVLLAVGGLNVLWTEEADRMRLVLFTTVWVIIIGIASAYHGQLWMAQAFVRAATVPLVIFAGAWLWRSFPATGDTPSSRLWMTAGVTIAIQQLAFYLLGFDRVAWVTSAMFAAAFVASSQWTAPSRQLLIVSILASACSAFVFSYFDFSAIPRVRFIPATSIVLTARFAWSSAATAVSIGIARALSRQRAGMSTVVMAVAILGAQFAYFSIGSFSSPWPRALYSMFVIATAAIAVSAFLKNSATDRLKLAHLAAIAVLGIGGLQFSRFATDYFTRYRAQAGNFETEGNARVAWEKVIALAQSRAVPAIYLAKVGPYGFADLYWEFYTYKHGRPDLLKQTTADKEFDAARVRALPDGSVVVTSASPQIDAAIAGLSADGRVRGRTLVVAPDGFSQFWVLETAQPGAPSR